MSRASPDLQQRYERLELLYQVATVIRSTLDPQEALQLILDQAIRLMRASSGSLALLNPTTGFLEIHAARGLPSYQGSLPASHDGLGLGLLVIRGDEAVDAETYGRIRADVLSRVRGTVQADILKEDQAQNTCIFSTSFSLRAMGDVQEWFVRNGMRNFYAVSTSEKIPSRSRRLLVSWPFE